MRLVAFLLLLPWLCRNVIAGDASLRSQPSYNQHSIRDADGSQDEAEVEHEGLEQELEREEKEEEEEEEEVAEADPNEIPANLAGAGMLLGSVPFVMSLFYLVNHYDEDIRKHSWRVISQTLCIFVAVLLFEALIGVQDVLMEKYVAEPSQFIILSLAYAVFSALYCIMHCAMATYGYQELPAGNDSDTPEIQRSNESRFSKQRQLKMMAWGKLTGHMCAFALVRTSGLLQHSETFRDSAVMAMLPVLLNAAMLLGLFRFSDAIRSSPYFYSDEAGYNRWDQVAEETENDISQISISYSIVVVLRFAVCGHLSNVKGVEQPLENHTLTAKALLASAGALFALLSVLIMSYVQRLELSHEELACEDETSPERSMSAMTSVLYESYSGLDPWNVYIQRWVYIVSTISAASFSWCAMFSTKWTMHGAFVSVGYSNYGSDPNSCLQHVLCALVISLASVVIICLLDCLDDNLDEAAANTDRAIRIIISAIAILVGFSWEQAFETGVEAISNLVAAESHEGLRYPVHRACTKLALAMFLAAVMIPAWLKHILKKTLGEQHCHCGAMIPHDGDFCHTCGRSLLVAEEVSMHSTVSIPDGKGQVHAIGEETVYELLDYLDDNGLQSYRKVVAEMHEMVTMLGTKQDSSRVRKVDKACRLML